MTSEDIEIAVARHWGVRANLIVPNASWGAGVHECDLLILSASNYLTEIEIKITKADLVKDLKKQHQHRSDKIKKMYYAMPESILFKNRTKELIPMHAGILIVSKTSYGDYSCTTERKAEKNKNAKSTTEEERFQLARLGALRIWDLKRRLQKVREAMI